MRRASKPRENTTNAARCDRDCSHAHNLSGYPNAGTHTHTRPKGSVQQRCAYLPPAWPGAETSRPPASLRPTYLPTVVPDPASSQPTYLPPDVYTSKSYVARYKPNPEGQMTVKGLPPALASFSTRQRRGGALQRAASRLPVPARCPPPPTAALGRRCTLQPARAPPRAPPPLVLRRARVSGNGVVIGPAVAVLAVAVFTRPIME